MMEWLVSNIGTIGWVWLGILIGVVAGVVASSFGAASKIGDLEAEIIQGRARDALKDEIFRLENQAKPKPRKRRKKRVVKTDKIKVGK